jgi:hypothetical protein
MKSDVLEDVELHAFNAIHRIILLKKRGTLLYDMRTGGTVNVLF